MMIVPRKLESGDEIRIISPATSLSIISQKDIDDAIKRLETMGLRVSFAENSKECDEFSSSSIKSRITDLHEAFSDKNIKAIITTIGGFNSNQLLSHINWNIIKKNPKIFCGFSDITTLSNAIFAKTGIITYSGPNFADFAQKKGFEYTLEYLQKCLFSNEPFDVIPSMEWSDDRWYLDQENRTFIKNSGPFVVNEGGAQGISLGGNMSTFNLLQGTEFMPSLKNSILFLEEDDLTGSSTDVTFDRYLQSLIHQKSFNKVKGILIGRFQNASEITKRSIIKIIKDKEELNEIPVIADVDFGHTNPKITFPIGGKVNIVADKNKIEIDILKH